MSGTHAADLAALDVLLKQRRIFHGDHAAGAQFAHLAEHRHDDFFRPAYLAALDALDRSGGRSAVEAVLFFGLLLRPGRQLDRLADGLDALHTHFRAKGLL